MFLNFFFNCLLSDTGKNCNIFCKVCPSPQSSIPPSLVSGAQNLNQNSCLGHTQLPLLPWTSQNCIHSLIHSLPGEGNGNLLQYSYLENLHGQRSLMGYSLCGHKELDTTEQLNNSIHSLTYLFSNTHFGPGITLSTGLMKIKDSSTHKEFTLQRGTQAARWVTWWANPRCQGAQWKWGQDSQKRPCLHSLIPASQGDGWPTLPTTWY